MSETHERSWSLIPQRSTKSFLQILFSLQNNVLLPDAIAWFGSNILCVLCAFCGETFCFVANANKKETAPGHPGAVSKQTP
jgi:hypothetical protein